MDQQFLAFPGLLGWDLNNLVSLSLGNGRQLVEGEYQHAALVGDGRQQMVGGLLQHHWKQRLGAFGQCENGLAFGVARHQIVEPGDEPVAGIAGHQQRLVWRCHDHGGEGGAGRQDETAGKGLAVAPCRRQGVGGEAVGPSGGV